MKQFTVLLLILMTALSVVAQNLPIDSTRYPKPVTLSTQQDHDNMMQQLGIKSLRPGPSGNENVPNHANYDESMANPCPQLPDLLTLKNGKKITTAEAWWKLRKPEIAEEIENQLYGRLPKVTPKVSWSVKISDREFVGRIPVLARHFTGHADNSDYPLINVDINMVLVLPLNVKGPVPVLIMFGSPVLPAPAQPSPGDLEKINAAFKEMMAKNNPEMKAIFEKYPAYSPITRLPGTNWFAPPANVESSPTEQLLAAGWGYATLEPSSIQADNGAGLTKGIIGLVNKGQVRNPNDWGSLRAWAWGAARALDYLETDQLVDAKRSEERRVGKECSEAYR